VTYSPKSLRKCAQVFFKSVRIEFDRVLGVIQARMILLHKQEANATCYTCTARSIAASNSDLPNGLSK